MYELQSSRKSNPSMLAGSRRVETSDSTGQRLHRTVPALADACLPQFPAKSVLFRPSRMQNPKTANILTGRAKPNSR